MTSQLTAELNRLHAAAGYPTVRDLGRMADTSHSTVAGMLRGRRVSSWPVVSAIVTALGGDPEAARPMWAAAMETHRADVGRQRHNRESDTLREVRAVRALVEELLREVRAR